ncbi:GNVR domain-containing protein [Thiohalophilus sp.]|uniref:GNVR domain-containing protein n=1 Tax=Thiohalophilus sp. TaxID=3028392 RepID=UPI002ACDE698|nr:GNVR domain-containing protein [Thiohalophilus sp.]MDZ7804371.1 GNVR domain-containing protein [Thiohalophilus sp.]
MPDHSPKPKSLFSAVIEKMKTRHNEQYREAVARLEKREQSLLNDIRGYRSQLDELDLVIKNIKGADAGHLALLMVNRGNVRDTIVAMEKDLVDAQSMLSDSFATHIVGKQLTKESPVKPKPKLVMALSIVLGLMLGVFAAFFAEFIARARNTGSGKEM